MLQSEPPEPNYSSVSLAIALQLAEELQTAGGMGVEQHAQHAPAEQGGENLDGPTPQPSGSIYDHCGRPTGSSTPSAHLQDQSRCWPISPATPTASPSPTAD
jgi:hypothetical protein